MKKYFWLFIMVGMISGLSSCTPDEKQENEVVIGFSQLGNESTWRERNTASIKEAAKKANYKLLFANGQQKQSKQIKDIRSFIASRVDVIVLSPIVETGWENVLTEARDAGIPVILNDRDIQIEDTSLYQTLVGTDSTAQGRKAGDFLKKKFEGTSEQIQIVEITGTPGSSSTENRSLGFRDSLNMEKRFEIVESQNADYMLSKGKQAMEKLYQQKQLTNVDVIFSHNDDMTLGIVEFLETTSIKPGKDVTIVSVDAQQEAIHLLKAGKINCTVECNPNTGPKLMSTITHLLNGGKLEPCYYLQEQVFSEFSNLSAIPERGY
ncbi:LacI family transcriptional regulator [Enterococcus florum]|uniref:LacI family transcriptional regulator n=1 Tax=Enterococcus florum TaxID=2480627 RepID=A0A4P5P4R7_9ENTE|nr:ABC transporter substrate-binding protein [Enterococcus florum]GCF92650.1 LacI family transcriptional regulator [Enterococcus florum]